MLNSNSVCFSDDSGFNSMESLNSDSNGEPQYGVGMKEFVLKLQ